MQERRWIRRYLADEVDMGTLTKVQYQQAYSSWRAIVHRYRLLFTVGFGAYSRATTFYRSCSELAYKKHHLVVLQHSDDEERAEVVRGKVSDLSQLIG